MPNDQAHNFTTCGTPTAREVAPIISLLKHNLSPLEQRLFVDLAAYTSRKGFPKEITYRLAEKYQKEHNLDANMALEQVSSFINKVLDCFSKLDKTNQYGGDFRKFSDVFKAIIEAKFPDAHRDHVIKILGNEKQTNSIITMLLDSKCIHIAQYKDTLQYIPTGDTIRILKFFRSLSGYSYEANHHELTSLMVLSSCRSDELKNCNNISYVDHMLSSKLTEEVRLLEEDEQLLVSAYIKSLKANRITPPSEPPNGQFYRGKEIDGPIVDFINSVYSAHMDGISFGRKELADADPKAERALRSYENRYGKVPLCKLNLPTKSQKNDALVAGLTPQQLIAARTTMQSKRRDILAPS